jgi:hypothetical protein
MIHFYFFIPILLVDSEFFLNFAAESIKELGYDIICIKQFVGISAGAFALAGRSRVVGQQVDYAQGKRLGYQ